MCFYALCTKKPFNSFVFCILLPHFHFVLEFFRADNRGATGFFLSPSQVMSVILIVYGVLLLLYRRGVIFKRKTKAQSADKTSENGESASENLENVCKNFEEKSEND